MPDNLGAPLDYSGLPPDALAGLQLVNLGPGRPSQPAIQQHPAQQQAAGGDMATALRQLVQIASTPQHPDQQTALRHLVALLHHASGGNQLQQGTQVAGDVIPFPVPPPPPVSSTMYSPNTIGKYQQPGGGGFNQTPWWRPLFPSMAANQG